MPHDTVYFNSEKNIKKYNFCVRQATKFAYFTSKRRNEEKNTLHPACGPAWAVAACRMLPGGLCGGAREIDEKTALCREKIEAGESPADALSQSGLFSGRDCSLLKLAERTGSLPETLEKLASRQEEESLRHIDRVVGTVEPAIVVITSVLAGVILLSVMLPMMGLLSGVG